MEEQQSGLNPVPQSTAPMTPSPLAPHDALVSEKPYAKVSTRIAAMILDGLIMVSLILLPLTLLVLVLGLESTESTSATNITNIILGVIALAYGIVLTKLYAGTPGKRFFKMKVADVEGRPLSWGKVIVREFIGKLVSGWILMLGYVWAIFDKKKQTWHDKIAGTYVLQDEPLSAGRKLIAYLFAGGVLVIFLLSIVGLVIIMTKMPSLLQTLQETEENNRLLEEDAIRQMEEINLMYEELSVTPYYDSNSELEYMPQTAE